MVIARLISVTVVMPSCTRPATNAASACPRTIASHTSAAEPAPPLAITGTETASAIADAVSVPVIASGGAGSAADVCDAIVRGHADAALVAGIVHDGITTVTEIKRAMTTHNIPVRAT